MFAQEYDGGLPVPRPPNEIENGFSAEDVLASRAHVFNIHRKDVTANFLTEACIALKAAQDHSIRIAILKSRSPACGNDEVYDGSFSGTRIPDMGVTTALLKAHGIEVFNEHQIARAHTI